MIASCVSSTRSLSVLLSAMGTSRTTQTASLVTVVRNDSRMCILAAATIRILARLLFEGGVYFAQSFRLCSYYSRAATIQRNTVVMPR